MVEVLIPNVLRPIPSALTQAIRNFAKNLENWMSSAMTGCPEKIVQIKLSAVSAFSQTLRRYTSLNHLAQAARAVLQNSTQITQMLSDLNRVDFHNVQVCFVLFCLYFIRVVFFFHVRTNQFIFFININSLKCTHQPTFDCVNIGASSMGM